MERYFYSEYVKQFLATPENSIIGLLSRASGYDITLEQQIAWDEQIKVLKEELKEFTGKVYFEYVIPRVNKRIDVVLIEENVLFVLEFKTGVQKNSKIFRDQALDYALDLKNFHQGSQDIYIVPILVTTNNETGYNLAIVEFSDDKIAAPIVTSAKYLRQALNVFLNVVKAPKIDIKEWESSSYSPTPTIIEAAVLLYSGHRVNDISRSDAGATNISNTCETVYSLIKDCHANKKKAICFLTGVPGAGKTLVGLNIATFTRIIDKKAESVFLSGNGPLVAILREALTRDKYAREKMRGRKIAKSKIEREVKSMIQNVHTFRDEYLVDKKAPYEHVAIFDEAQRAWDKIQTAKFLKKKNKVESFEMSEPEFLLSCMDRHADWAVVICLVGGGQEINTGEAGIAEWIEATREMFPEWNVYISPNLNDSEYAAGEALSLLKGHTSVFEDVNLHLSVSMRSFRAESVSHFVKKILDEKPDAARQMINSFMEKFPVCLTREITTAREWLLNKAKGSERIGLIASSQAYRLKAVGIHVKATINPVSWFLESKHDVRSSNFLEDVATEFQVQGLELDWAAVLWDADLRIVNKKWHYYSFSGTKWKKIEKAEKKKYLKNAYRVLLTRARQGMIIYIPKGDQDDDTRNPDFYNGITEYLKTCGIQEI